jgi:hypothetical protein
MIDMTPVLFVQAVNAHNWEAARRALRSMMRWRVTDLQNDADLELAILTCLVSGPFAVWIDLREKIVPSADVPLRSDPGLWREDMLLTLAVANREWAVGGLQELQETVTREHVQRLFRVPAWSESIAGLAADFAGFLSEVALHFEKSFPPSLLACHEILQHAEDARAIEAKVFGCDLCVFRLAGRGLHDLIRTGHHRSALAPAIAPILASGSWPTLRHLLWVKSEAPEALPEAGSAGVGPCGDAFLRAPLPGSVGPSRTEGRPA